jgi:3,4-dihydroxy 2-butanone 4-phosphate synthase/GTP cyclohydrolase II
MTDAAVFSYLLDDNGEISSPSEAQAFAKKNDIPAIALSTILSWRLRHECLIEQIASSELPTLLGGDLRMHVFRSLVDSSEQVALVKGSIDPNQPTLVRVHVEEPIDDLIGTTSSAYLASGNSHLSSSRSRLEIALKYLDQAPCGVLVYLRPSLQRYALSTRILETNSPEQPTPTHPPPPKRLLYDRIRYRRPDITSCWS